MHESFDNVYTYMDKLQLSVDGAIIHVSVRGGARGIEREREGEGRKERGSKGERKEGRFSAGETDIIREYVSKRVTVVKLQCMYYVLYIFYWNCVRMYTCMFSVVGNHTSAAANSSSEWSMSNNAV